MLKATPRLGPGGSMFRQRRPQPTAHHAAQAKAAEVLQAGGSGKGALHITFHKATSFQSPPGPRRSPGRPVSSARADSAPRSGLWLQSPHSPAVVFLFNPKVTFLELDGVLLSCGSKRAVRGGAPAARGACGGPTSASTAPQVPPPGKEAEQAPASAPQLNPRPSAQGSLLTPARTPGPSALGL